MVAENEKKELGKISKTRTDRYVLGWCPSKGRGRSPWRQGEGGREEDKPEWRQRVTMGRRGKLNWPNESWTSQKPRRVQSPYSSPQEAITVLVQASDMRVVVVFWKTGQEARRMTGEQELLLVLVF